jgi:hypothetical protein
VWKHGKHTIFHGEKPDVKLHAGQGMKGILAEALNFRED